MFSMIEKFSSQKNRSGMPGMTGINQPHVGNFAVILYNKGACICVCMRKYRVTGKTSLSSLSSLSWLDHRLVRTAYSAFAALGTPGATQVKITPGRSALAHPSHRLHHPTRPEGRSTTRSQARDQARHNRRTTTMTRTTTDQIMTAAQCEIYGQHEASACARHWLHG